ncbi:MAG: SRPBCC family protein [Pyrinomonadaceae bacterium]
MIKKILIAIILVALVLVVGVAIAAFVSPTDFKVERAVTINRPKAEVFNYVKLLKNQNEWGPWYKKDTNMTLASRGTDGTVGYVATWESKNDDVGAGEQEIKRIVEGDRIDTELRFSKPFESKSDAYMLTEAAGENQTKVRWGFSGSMPRPLNLMMVMMDMDKAVGKDFEDGLTNLKTIMEKQ